MSPQQPSEDDYVNNDVYDGLRLRSLTQLAWAIESSVGQFKLILARCNYARERDRLISRLQEICQVEIRVLAVQQSNRTLYTAIQEEFGEEIPACVMVVGLESANISEVLSDIPERVFKSKDLSLYRFILGRSQCYLKQIQEATLSLEAAINLGNPLEDVRLYLDILRFLQQLYFEQKEYLKAYNIKQQQRSVEQQFGLRAFIGAGRLEATKQAFVETLRSNSPQGNIAPEIAASGRLLDVERLIERIGRSDYKLIVIYGESGVGKSSLVNAGLVPALKNKAIGIQDYLPVVMRVYTNWVEELGKLLGGCEEWRVCRDAIHRVSPEWRESEPQHSTSELGSSTSELGSSTSELGTSTSELGTSTSELGTSTSELGTSTSELGTSTSELGTSTSELGGSTFDIQNTHSLLVSSSSRPNADAMNRVSTKSLITQLRENEQRNLRTVLIFDQFEEFFFAYTEPAQRKQFFEFLRECLNVVQSLRVILSLRVDYIHYLLEFNDLSSLKIVGDGILCNHVLYKLGNFSPADAKSIIQRLTENTSFRLEPALVEQLVLDLAGELGEVRPIELQVVGAQLQTENITTLAEYRQGGTKDELVKRYLDEVVNDCGEENYEAAEILLYLLTDEKGTRPLKTRAELKRDLYNTLSGEADKTQFSPSNVDLVLEIFVQSSLVVLLPENPADRYQLVHDYIAAFIRQQRKLKLKDLMVAELEIALKEANTANQMKSQFWATTSHELRTPINIIINCIRLVHDGLCDNREEEMEFLMRADQTAIHLLSIINDLLEISNIEAGRLSVVTEPIDLRQILLEVVNLELVYEVQKKGLQFSTALGTEPILVKANAVKLKQVLINVIGNAIKFTEEGSITITAEIHHSVDKSQAIVNVTDTGIGIDPAQQHKLFRPFVMLDSVNTPKFNSMGLGLAVSRNLIELMGGSIILESAGLNQGTTVTMFLPLIDISLLPVLDR